MAMYEKKFVGSASQEMYVGGGQAQQQRRMDGILDRLCKLAVYSQELAGRIEAITDRTVGARPKNETTTGLVAPNPNSTLQRLEEIERQLSNSFEYIRSELQELEAAI